MNQEVKAEIKNEKPLDGEAHPAASLKKDNSV